jgi:hypothetical protein
LKHPYLLRGLSFITIKIMPEEGGYINKKGEGFTPSPVFRLSDFF